MIGYTARVSSAPKSSRILSRLLNVARSVCIDILAVVRAEHEYAIRAPDRQHVPWLPDAPFVARPPEELRAAAIAVAAPKNSRRGRNKPRRAQVNVIGDGIG